MLEGRSSRAARAEEQRANPSGGPVFPDRKADQTLATSDAISFKKTKTVAAHGESALKVTNTL